MKKIIVAGCFLYLSFFPNLSSAKIPDDIFFLGTKEGEGMLFSPRQILEGPDRNIYAYDQGDAFIKIYSTRGEYLRRIGGRGQGPGEIQRADGFHFGFTPDGQLHFNEFFGGHPWITIMELSGKFINVLHPDLKETFGIKRSVSLEDGDFLIELWLSPKPEAKEDYFFYHYPQILVRINSEGHRVSEIIQRDDIKTISSFSDGADQWLPFLPLFEWIYMGNGAVIYTDGLSKSLSVYDLQGNSMKPIQTDLPVPRKIVKRDIEDWKRKRKDEMKDSFWFKEFGSVIDKYKTSLYDRIPVFHKISLTPQGYILITGPWRQGEETDYWLLDQKGRIIIHVRLNGQGLTISEHYIFLRTVDVGEEDLIVCLRRSKDEAQDLGRLESIQRNLPSGFSRQDP